MKLLRRIVVIAAIVLVALYAAIVGYMFFNQRALQYDAEGPITPLAETALTQARAIALPSGDGTINGWYQPPRPGMPIIVYYKGNSGSFSREHERYARFVADGYGFIAFDYRGFPASPGAISEDNILTDALTAFDWAAEQGAPLLIWGRSLGSGPATYVASQRDAAALLLETPFLSAVTVAGERYPVLPVSLVMQDQFRNDQWIAEVSEPVLVAHGTADTTIGVSNGERLYALAPNPVDLWIVPGAGHSDLWDAGIWAEARPFFEQAMTP
ncbi:MAG: alpha/beta hydrolase [Devosia sp.]|uniref:alpha/beta hydrolase n=1 Tax=Devosia sp. TaxID=1871048 RepID=UPI0024C924EC|nr:alpha/beta hydrolase [Devosia sp.]UYN98244.1 MAG: alpha/beta hydrolase [Devosia sp.]